MTRRERLERKLDRRQEWAGKASARSDARANAANEISQRFEMGQPILVGHHSEAKARQDRDRMDANMRGAIDEQRKAEHHADKAAGLARQLDRTIFSDDADAIEKLESKISDLETKRDEMKRRNAAFKKDGIAGLVARGMTEKGATALMAARKSCADKVPYPPYELTSAGAEIRRRKKRIEEIRRRQAQQEAAQQAGGVLVQRAGEGGQQAVVTFSERPEYGVIEALKAAGFRWSAPSWYGPASALPEGIE